MGLSFGAVGDISRPDGDFDAVVVIKSTARKEIVDLKLLVVGMVRDRSAGGTVITPNSRPQPQSCSTETISSRSQRSSTPIILCWRSLE